MSSPREELGAVIRNTKPGGRFHCWVYAREGNGPILWLVEPLRRLCSRLPWWITKYLVAIPLALPFFTCAKVIAHLPRSQTLKGLPLYEYSPWIAGREIGFFRNVAFDQLVTPRTRYFSGETIARWLAEHPCVDRDGTYIIVRNGNSRKYGGKVQCAS